MAFGHGRGAVMTTFYYSTDDVPADDAWAWVPVECNSPYGNEDSILEDVAETAAKEYFWQCDGAYSDWPVTFYIKGEVDNYLGKVLVELEYDPLFWGHIIKD